MALIDRENNDIDYNKFARIGRELKPGMIWVTSGAAEIGRLDYVRRAGHELAGDQNEAKTDYAAQGQAILMEKYREFVDDKYGVRQLLVEHQHFNDPVKREHIKGLLLRAAAQNCIPVVNYNDAVSYEEIRKLEIQSLREGSGGKVVELVDNDETAAQIACLMKAQTLLILTTAEGIYALVNRLSEELKNVFLLRFAYDLPLKEIGKTLGLSESNVAVRLHRAKKKLAEYLMKGGYASETV